MAASSPLTSSKRFECCRGPHGGPRAAYQPAGRSQVPDSAVMRPAQPGWSAPVTACTRAPIQETGGLSPRDARGPCEVATQRVSTAGPANVLGPAPAAGAARCARGRGRGQRRASARRRGAAAGSAAQRRRAQPATGADDRRPARGAARRAAAAVDRARRGRTACAGARRHRRGAGCRATHRARLARHRGPPGSE